FLEPRPGEKLFEEMLTAEEGTKASRHKQIFIARESGGHSKFEIEKILREFESRIKSGQGQGVRELLKKYVTHYEGKCGEAQEEEGGASAQSKYTEEGVAGYVGGE
ncbi:MAG: hypothetical protein Q7T24_01220, partial [Deltaproteobacteria bacterium]|nr:hypothetical protein [Deltaproteobacteria bacterium]